MESAFKTRNLSADIFMLSHNFKHPMNKKDVHQVHELPTKNKLIDPIFGYINKYYHKENIDLF